ncbi:ATPase F0/V0 complex subunit C [Penicillium cf. griseofulvum]|uniref:V-type proton ATPase proteolipid subunit n=1 Tax=Penicillium cf. griseofulvum TaxID=2972120 RepID=A0A9W9JKZ6_9EURO|nr:ATPase F0/V0 complex subunit C [Penicillium cf. griseofulvum]KAJ5443137.1 ATPase F0/V0 complex subunit C [Penicillium cf. griseofulvum]KAJ5451409.1 ATPase F0/V0 complex subunit C [Penicillium cf. griseofulvum]
MASLYARQDAIRILPFFGALGCASAIIFTTFGAAYGTAKSGVGICSSGILRPDLIVKSIAMREKMKYESSANKSLDIVPVVMAGILGIYGLVVSVLIANNLVQRVPLYTGLLQLGAGLSVGLCGLAAGGFADQDEGLPLELLVMLESEERRSSLGFMLA